MTKAYENQHLSRRGSKLLVELVIGIIGLMGILLAQYAPTTKHSTMAEFRSELAQGLGAGKHDTTAATRIDWLDILF